MNKARNSCRVVTGKLLENKTVTRKNVNVRKTSYDNGAKFQGY
jgi:hypothetical protein